MYETGGEGVIYCIIIFVLQWHKYSGFTIIIIDLTFLNIIIMTNKYLFMPQPPPGWCEYILSTTTNFPNKDIPRHKNISKPYQCYYVSTWSCFARSLWLRNPVTLAVTSFALLILWETSACKKTIRNMKIYGRQLWEDVYITNEEIETSIGSTYHAPVTYTNRLGTLISGESNSALGALVTENISTVPAMMLQ